MRHFMAQFGPALEWPWTKLTDVPELTDELLDTIVAQSDEQAGGLSVRELEQLRDDCLVSVSCRRCARATSARARCSRGTSRRSRPRRRSASWPTTTTSRSRSPCTPRRSSRTGSTTTATRTRAATCRSSATPPTRSTPTSASTPRTCASGSYFTVESHLCAPARGAARRSPRGHDAGARLRCAPAARLPLALPRGRRRAAGHGRADVRCTSTPPRGGRRRRRRRCSRASSASRRRTPHCRAPSAPAARSASRGRDLPSGDVGVEPGDPPGRRTAPRASALHVAVGARRHDHHVDVPGTSRCASCAPSSRSGRRSGRWPYGLRLAISIVTT